MIRILIAGDCSPRSISNPVSYLRALRRVNDLGAVGMAETKQDADAMAQGFDALLLPGGNDIPASHFGQPPHVACQYDDPLRDLSDQLLLEAFLARGKRVLGVCRGCQAGNIFLGGTLHQHLPDAYSPVLWHSGNITGRHSATVSEGTLLSSLLGAGEIRVNSSHHQAIALPGEGLRVSATAPDGVIEAAEGENILLVQWHPERMDEDMLPLFHWLAGRKG